MKVHEANQNIYKSTATAGKKTAHTHKQINKQNEMATKLYACVCV